MSPCAEDIWSRFGAEFGPSCCAVLVLKRDLYALMTASNSFYKYCGYFLRNLGITPSRAYYYLWIIKSEYYEGYSYIVTHVDDVIIATNNPSKYKHDI